MKINKLHNIKKTGFKVPEDYFDNLEDTILLHKALKKLSIESGFKTPNDYFDNLENTILNNISDKKSPKVISIFRRRNLIYVSSIAAAVVLLFNLSLFEKETGWEAIKAETVENYIINENMGSYEIASLLIDDDFNKVSFTAIELSEEALENYLLEQTTVEDLIIH